MKNCETLQLPLPGPGTLHVYPCNALDEQAYTEYGEFLATEDYEDLKDRGKLHKVRDAIYNKDNRSPAVYVYQKSTVAELQRLLKDRSDAVDHYRKDLAAFPNPTQQYDTLWREFQRQQHLVDTLETRLPQEIADLQRNRTDRNGSYTAKLHALTDLQITIKILKEQDFPMTQAALDACEPTITAIHTVNALLQQAPSLEWTPEALRDHADALQECYLVLKARKYPYLEAIEQAIFEAKDLRAQQNAQIMNESRAATAAYVAGLTKIVKMGNWRRKKRWNFAKGAGI